MHSNFSSLFGTLCFFLEQPHVACYMKMLQQQRQDYIHAGFAGKMRVYSFGHGKSCSFKRIKQFTDSFSVTCRHIIRLSPAVHAFIPYHTLHLPHRTPRRWSASFLLTLHLLSGEKYVNLIFLFFICSQNYSYLKFRFPRKCFKCVNLL